MAGLTTRPTSCFRGCRPSNPEVLFNTVQQVLTGRKATPATKRKHNPRLPLKWFVKCHDCGTPLTGGFSKGRSRKYGHYWCRNGSCKAVRTSKANLETEFIKLLRRVLPAIQSGCDVRNLRVQ